MAKRGYRGKHPHSDMKVSKKPSSNKYSSKLNKEYKKLKTKLKYDYIRTHYYYPQSTCTLTIDGAVSNDQVITLISTDGTSVAYTAKATEDAGSNEFKSGDPSGSLATCINHASGHDGKIVAVASAGSVLLTQEQPGPDGNTSVSGSVLNVSASGQVGAVSVNGSFSF